MEQATVASVPITNFHPTKVLFSYSLAKSLVNPFHLHLFQFHFFFPLILSLFITPMVQWKIETSWMEVRHAKRVKESALSFLSEESFHFTPWRFGRWWVSSFAFLFQFDCFHGNMRWKSSKRWKIMGIEGKGYDIKWISIEIHWKWIISEIRYAVHLHISCSEHKRLIADCSMFKSFKQNAYLLFEILDLCHVPFAIYDMWNVKFKTEC